MVKVTHHWKLLDELDAFCQNVNILVQIICGESYTEGAYLQQATILIINCANLVYDSTVFQYSFCSKQYRVYTLHQISKLNVSSDEPRFHIPYSAIQNRRGINIVIFQDRVHLSAREVGSRFRNKNLKNMSTILCFKLKKTTIKKDEEVTREESTTFEYEWTSSF